MFRWGIWKINEEQLVLITATKSNEFREHFRKMNPQPESCEQLQKPFSGKEMK